MTPARLHKPSHVTVQEGGSDRADWRREGVCVTWTAWPADPWYPDEHATSTDPVKRAAAWAKGRALCAGCPIRLLCLEDALAHESGSSYYRHGMRGGLDDTERANLARSRQRKTKREAAATFQGSRLDDIVLLLADGVAPENIALRLHSSLQTLARSARRAGARDIANQFERADRVVNPDAYHLRDRRGNAAKKRAST